MRKQAYLLLLQMAKVCSGVCLAISPEKAGATKSQQQKNYAKK